ncbi:hypothetical protein BH23PSE1_BH23PSE1_10170 [soil metagenome]
MAGPMTGPVGPRARERKEARERQASGGAHPGGMPPFPAQPGPSHPGAAHHEHPATVASPASQAPHDDAAEPFENASRYRRGPGGTAYRGKDASGKLPINLLIGLVVLFIVGAVALLAVGFARLGEDSGGDVGPAPALDDPGPQREQEPEPAPGPGPEPG